MHFIVRALALVLLYATGCALVAAQKGADAAKADAPQTRASRPLSSVMERAGITPRVDHHQHIVGPAAAIRWPALAPAAELPPEIGRVVQERNRVMGTQEVGDLYTETAQVLDVQAESRPWARGRDAVRRVVGSYDPATRFVPQAFAAGDPVAYVTGVATAGSSPETRMNFVLGLRKDGRGVWRIETEQATPIPPPPFVAPLTADQLVRDMDETGIERAAVLSVAYFFATPPSPTRTWPGDEYANVRAENDWVAAQVARHPGRLVAFCGVSPLKDYAEQEVRRCARELRMKGLKLHFRSSRVNVLDPEHLEKVRRVFRTANELGLAIVVHTNIRPYGREQAEVFLKELLPAAPDVVVQIAHLWGGNEFVPAALGVFADAVAAKDPRAKNLYFDLTEVQPAAEITSDPEATMREIARLIRRIGLKRVLYGSDAAATPDAPPTALRWARLRRALPLTNDELRVIAGNVAPYMR
ncbi:MAG TPA: amidohydrolase family protein [Pyrinomonadaceae bacterium]|jgi:predicted TIM-barrel fold metal-dependent hydrolase